MARLPPQIRITRRLAIPSSEIELSFARSGGPGGQHVNKTSSKVTLRWNLERSAVLDEALRLRLRERLAARLTREGDLLVHAERHREQGRNVQDALDRFADLLRTASRRPTPRRKTRPSRAARERRLAEKRRRSDLKRRRREPPA